jgi:hypothetical protein
MPQGKRGTPLLLIGCGATARAIYEEDLSVKTLTISIYGNEVDSRIVASEDTIEAEMGDVAVALFLTEEQRIQVAAEFAKHLPRNMCIQLIQRIVNDINGEGERIQQI